MSRRKARVLALEALYAWDITKSPVEELLRFGWMEPEKSAGVKPQELAFSRVLVAGTIEHITHIDREIEKHLCNWELSRLKRVDLAILRVSAYSLLFQKEVHAAVVINEAVELCMEYSADDAFKFVNAILDNIKMSAAAPGGAAKTAADA